MTRESSTKSPQDLPRNHLSREYYEFTNITRTFPSPQFVLGFLYRDSSPDDATLRLEITDASIEKEKTGQRPIARTLRIVTTSFSPFLSLLPRLVRHLMTQSFN